MPKKLTPFEITLTGQVVEPAEDKLLMLVEVLCTIAQDFEVKIDYPALISLDEPSRAEEKPK